MSDIEIGKISKVNSYLKVWSRNGSFEGGRLAL